MPHGITVEYHHTIEGKVVQEHVHNKPKEPMFGAALPAVLRRPQRFANYDPRPDLPFEDAEDERRPMTMLVAVLYGAAWGLAIVGIVVANWGR